MKVKFIVLTIVLCSLDLYAQFEKVAWQGSSVASLLKEGQTFYCATLLGGVYRSTNEGDTWEPMNEGIASDHYHLQTKKLAITNGHFLLVTQGSLLFDHLHRRAKSNGTWQRISLPVSDTATILDIIPVGGDSLFILLEYIDDDTTYSKNGVYFSSNAGTSWSKRNNGLPPALNGMALTRIGEVVCLSTLKFDTVGFDDYEIGGVFLSTDYGLSWTRTTQGIGEQSYFWLMGATPSTLFGERYDHDGDDFIYAGIARSTDSGLTWTNTGSIGIDPANTYVFDFSVVDTLMVAAMSESNYVTSDQGATWVEMLPDQRYLIPYDVCRTSDGILLGTSAGVLLTSDDLGTATQASTRETGLLAYHYILTYVGHDSLFINDAYGGDDGTLVGRSIDEGLLWSGLRLPTDFVMGDVAWVTVHDGTYTGGRDVGNARAVVLRAENPNQPWEIFAQMPRAGVVTAFDKLGDTILVGIAGDDFRAACYLSTNNGLTWRIQTAGSSFAETITVAKFMGPNILVVDDFGFWFFSTDRGKTWSENLTGMPNLFNFRALATQGSTHIAAGYQYDFPNQTYLPEAYGSNDNGVTWDITGNGLPDDVRLQTIVADQGVPGVFYISTDPTAGFTESYPSHSNTFVTTNGGLSWKQFADDLPHAERLFVGSNYLFAQGQNGLYRAPKVLGAVEGNPRADQELPRLTAFPNPAIDRISVSFTISEPSTISIGLYDVLGKAITILEPVYSTSGTDELTYDMSKLESGVYHLYLKAGAETVSTTIIKAQ